MIYKKSTKGVSFTTSTKNSIGCPNNNPKAISYDFEWINVTNNFTNANNIVYDFYRNGTKIISDSSAPYVRQTLKTNEIVAANSVNTYKIVYKFKDNGTNQNVDKNKTFKANVKVTAVAVSN